MDSVKRCPACQKENPEGAVLCAFCGFPLLGLLPSPTTVKVPDEPIKPVVPEQITQITALYKDIIAFLMAGHEKPLLVKGDRKLVLGRTGFADEDAPGIDLTPYGGIAMGVSRQHAAISRPGDQYVIQDLGSTNGTWLNEIRLSKDKFYNLTSGDLIRLGQLAIYVYFSMANTRTPNDESIQLKYEFSSPTPLTLTPSSLTTAVMPYLNALAAIQTICNEILRRSPLEIAIRAITVDVPSEQIVVQLSGAGEAMLLVRNRLVVWRRLNREKIADWVRTTNGSATREVRPELRDVYAQMTLAYLRELAPEQAEADRKAALERIQSHLDVLATSRLQAQPVLGTSTP